MCRAALRMLRGERRNGVMGPKARRRGSRGLGAGSRSVHCLELGWFRPVLVAHCECVVAGTVQSRNRGQAEGVAGQPRS